MGRDSSGNITHSELGFFRNGCLLGECRGRRGESDVASQPQLVVTLSVVFNAIVYSSPSPPDPAPVLELFLKGIPIISTTPAHEGDFRSIYENSRWGDSRWGDAGN